MTTPAGPWPPEGPDPRNQPRDAPLPDEPNPFGPDMPNVREDDPARDRGVPEAPSPSTPPTPAPPDEPLELGDFAPDEA